MQLVNGDIALVAADFERAEPAPLRWGFACECGTPGCREWVRLDLVGYEAARGCGAGLVLAPGHGIARALAARRQAGKLRENAAGLRGQARAQVARARRGAGVIRDYHAELRDGEKTIATARLPRVAPLEAGDTVYVLGILGTVERVEPIVRSMALRLVVQIHPAGRRKSSQKPSAP
jgi:hypothetical protein